MSTGTFINKNTFSKRVEQIARGADVGFMDAIVETCEEYNIEVEYCKKYLSDSIKNKLEREAISMNLLPKDTFVPIE